MSTFRVIVLYPNGDDLKFDFDYYVEHHAALAHEHWDKHGFLGGMTIKLEPMADGSPPPYYAQGILVWPSAEAWEKARTSEDGQIIAADVINYTNKAPIFIPGHLLKSTAGENTV